MLARVLICKRILISYKYLETNPIEEDSIHSIKLYNQKTMSSSSPYRIQPEHIQWLQGQLEARQVKLSQGNLLSLMTDFWTKNGGRLAAKKIQEETAIQILNNKLLDVLLSRFKKNDSAMRPAEAQAIAQAVQAQMEMPPYQTPNGGPNQTPQWADRPTMGAIRTMTASEMDERMKQMNLDRDSLFPKPKPVQFNDDNTIAPNIPTVPTDTLYETLLIEREKQAKAMGLSALTPEVGTTPGVDAPQGSSLSTSLNALQNATVSGQSNAPGSQEMELRVANTLPRPVQGNLTNAGDPPGLRPMPRNFPTGSVPEVAPEYFVGAQQQQAPKPPSALRIPENAQMDTGRLLPQGMENQAGVPSRDEYMKMALEQSRADLRASGQTNIYDATGAFAKAGEVDVARAVSDPIALSSSANGVVKSGAALVPSGGQSSYDERKELMKPENVNGVNDRTAPMATMAGNGTGATPITEGFTPMGPSFPGSTSSGMGAREEWRQNRDLYQAGLSGGPLPNPIMNIGRNILPTYIPEYQTYHWYMTIDSIHRDLEQYPHPAHFKVRFEEPSESIEVPSRIGEKGEIIYEQPIRYEFSGGNGAKLERTYSNVVSVSCPHAIIPLDINYIYGKAPYSFNGPVSDENKVAATTNFPSFPYGPIWKSDYGIPRDILDEPYLCLHVEELDGLYDGTSKTIRDALSVLMYDSRFSGQSIRPFIHFTTAMGEKKVYTPTALGELSQMTLRLLKRNNTVVNMGVDKTFIASITEGDVVPSGSCDLPAGSHLTKITISSSHPQYPCGDICSADVMPGNLLYFFSMFGCNPATDATPLNSHITLNLSGYPTASFVFYDPSQYANPVTVDVSPFLSIGDIIIVNNEYLFDVTGIAYDGLSVTLNSRDTTITPSALTVTQVSYIKKRLRGFQSEDTHDMNYQGGEYVVKGDTTDPLTFQIQFPYENLPSYMKSAPDGTYKNGDAFFIRQNKQITYSFEVVVLQPRTDQLTSRLMADGGRPM
jgi:hypothetical protein